MSKRVLEWRNENFERIIPKKGYSKKIASILPAETVNKVFDEKLSYKRTVKLFDGQQQVQPQFSAEYFIYLADYTTQDLEAVVLDNPTDEASDKETGVRLKEFPSIHLSKLRDCLLEFSKKKITAFKNEKLEHITEIVNETLQLMSESRANELLVFEQHGFQIDSLSQQRIGRCI